MRADTAARFGSTPPKVTCAATILGLILGWGQTPASTTSASSGPMALKNSSPAFPRTSSSPCGKVLEHGPLLRTRRIGEYVEAFDCDLRHHLYYNHGDTEREGRTCVAKIAHRRPPAVPQSPR